MAEHSSFIDIIGVPLDLGANIRGSCMGPAAIRIADIHKKLAVQGYPTNDLGDLLVPVRETVSEHDRDQKYLNVIQRVCDSLSQIVLESLGNNNIPITIGGDHCIAIGSISGAAAHFQKSGQELGLIWFDAHADLNTPETSPSGNIHGMPVASLIGQGHKELISIGFDGPKIKPENIAIVGIRSVDAQEKRICQESGIHYYSMREIDEKGIFAVMDEVISHLQKKTEGLYVSFDLDGIDPQYAPGVSTPVTGGLSYREAHLALEMIADTKRLVGMDMVELNPMTDKQHKSALLAVELIQSALGKSII